MSSPIQKTVSPFHNENSFYSVCFYHGGCPDGIAAAFCFKQLNTSGESKILLVPIFPNINYKQLNDAVKKQHLCQFDPKDDVLQQEHYLIGLNVVCVDICPVNAIEELHNKCYSLLVIDHHKSNYEFIKENFSYYITDSDEEQSNKSLKFVFDMNESGASLAYKYCKSIYDKRSIYRGEDGDDTGEQLFGYAGTKLQMFEQCYPSDIPWFINYVKDADLWEWKLESSKEVYTALNKLGYFKSTTKLLELVNIDTEEKFNDFLKEKLLPCAKEEFKLRKHVIDNAISNKTEVYCLELLRESPKVKLTDSSILECGEHKTNIYNLLLVQTITKSDDNDDEKFITSKIYKKHNVLLTNVADGTVISELGNQLCKQKMERVYPNSQYDFDKYVNDLRQMIKLFQSKDELTDFEQNTLDDAKVIVDNTLSISDENGDVLPDFAAVWTYNFVRDEIKVSLRSVGDIDVSSVAKLFGGGGHKNASGFSLYGKHGQTLHDVFTLNENPILLR